MCLQCGRNEMDASYFVLLLVIIGIVNTLHKHLAIVNAICQSSLKQGCCTKVWNRLCQQDDAIGIKHIGVVFLSVCSPQFQLGSGTNHLRTKANASASRQKNKTLICSPKNVNGRLYPIQNTTANCKLQKFCRGRA